MTAHLDGKATATGEIFLEVEELEEAIAPAIALNHNEALVGDEVEAGVRESGATSCPGIQS